MHGQPRNIFKEALFYLEHHHLRPINVFSTSQKDGLLQKKL